MIVAGLAILVLFWLYYRWQQTEFTFPQAILYAIGYFLVRFLWHAKVIGKIPKLSTGAIIICNHRGPFDPAFIQFGFLRFVRWMVAKEYMEARSLQWFFRWVNFIPVGRRGVDTTSMRMAVRYAQEGNMIGMFPEGRLNTTEDLLLPCRPGFVRIALAANVPIIPCYIEGSPCNKTILLTFFTFSKTTLTIGEPIYIKAQNGLEKERDFLNSTTIEVLNKIGELAGQKDFRPQLSGKHWGPEEGGNPNVLN